MLNGNTFFLFLSSLPTYRYPSVTMLLCCSLHFSDKGLLKLFVLCGYLLSAESIGEFLHDSSRILSVCKDTIHAIRNGPPRIILVLSRILCKLFSSSYILPVHLFTLLYTSFLLYWLRHSFMLTPTAPISVPTTSDTIDRQSVSFWLSLYKLCQTRRPTVLVASLQALSSALTVWQDERGSVLSLWKDFPGSRQRTNEGWSSSTTLTRWQKASDYSTRLKVSKSKSHQNTNLLHWNRKWDRDLGIDQSTHFGVMWLCAFHAHTHTHLSPW